MSDDGLGSENRLRSDERFYRAVYVISVAAELAGVHPQTLRIYDRKGLLDPARTAGGSRRYSDADIARVERISELTEEGLNLAGVMRVLELEQRVAELEGRVRAQAQARQRRAADLQAAQSAQSTDSARPEHGHGHEETPH